MRPVGSIESFKQEAKMKTTLNIEPTKTLIRIKEVCERTGLSRSYLYQLSKVGNFPQSISLVPGGTSVAWVASEVDEWVNQRIAKRDGGESNA